jgi:uncharacterized damage-inducible protein DinB
MGNYLPGDRPVTTGLHGERETLRAFLDLYRWTLEQKCAGLTPAQLGERAVPPSSLSLLGLVRHLGDVEHGWFRRLAGEQPRWRYSTADNSDGDFDDVEGTQQQVDDAFAYWRQEVEFARQLSAEGDLDAGFVRERDGSFITLRWVLVHMIEEYARHLGHADLLRERIDGATGY